MPARCRRGCEAFTTSPLVPGVLADDCTSDTQGLWMRREPGGTVHHSFFRASILLLKPIYLRSCCWAFLRHLQRKEAKGHVGARLGVNSTRGVQVVSASSFIHFYCVEQTYEMRSHVPLFRQLFSKHILMSSLPSHWT